MKANQEQAAPLSIGLAIGEGTGPELATVFRRAVGRIADVHGRSIAVIACPHRFRTFSTSLDESLPTAEVIRIKNEDCDRYVQFLRELHGAGCDVVFRTAINAETLYQAREQLLGTKLEVLPTPRGELFLVRDEAQGFYAGRNDHESPDVIRRVCEFRRDWTETLLDHARAAAAAHWGGADRIDHIVLAYKFHLLDNRFARWVSDYGRTHNVRLQLYQPDTTNRHLLRDAFAGNVLIVGANEWVDIAHVELLARYGMGPQENRHTRNEYLAPAVAGMVEYQTVHGSADDIAGRGLVNPIATLRAAAEILEQRGACQGAAARMERAIERSLARGCTTPDLGGDDSTDTVAGYVLDQYAAGDTHTSGHAPTPDSPGALLVVDMQHDLCAEGGRFHRLGLVDPAAMRVLARRIGTLVAWARASGVEVIFTRMLGDPDSLPANVVERNRRLGRQGYLLDGTPGAALFGVEPAPGELVVSKRGYDPFVGTALERHLRDRGVGHLLLAGVFADVCVDAAARTAYQLGFQVTVPADATVALRRELDETLEFMRYLYDARITTIAGLDEIPAPDSPPERTLAALP